MIIKYFGVNEYELGNKDEVINFGLRLTIDANVHLEEIIDKLNCQYTWDYNNDLNSQYIELTQIPDTNFKEIAFETIENIQEVIQPNAEWLTGYYGLIQLISLKMISENLKEQ